MLLDLDGRSTNPLGETASEGSQEAAPTRVFVFTRTDCPTSNRFAPEVRRIHGEFAAQGVRFWLVYPDPDDTAEMIRSHLAAFGYPIDVLRDPHQTLVQLTQAVRTPEAAVFVNGHHMVYRGRIDDRYTEFGVERGAPTKRDLRDVLTAVLAGEEVEPYTAPAVGCEIPDPA